MGNMQFRDAFCGTTNYLAPEMITEEGHDASLNMWAMGVLLFEMVVGRAPFALTSGQSPEETSQQMNETCKNILSCKVRYPSNIDRDCQDLIASLLQLQRKARLTAQRPSVAERRYCDSHDMENLEWQCLQLVERKQTVDDQLLEVLSNCSVVIEDLRLEKSATDRARKERIELRHRIREQEAVLKEIRQHS
eukprot:6190584-Amphidinium_carterae.1